MLVAVDASCQCDNDRILDTHPTEVIYILYGLYTHCCIFKLGCVAEMNRPTVLQ